MPGGKPHVSASLNGDGSVDAKEVERRMERIQKALTPQ
jgi:hypothetical protein